MWALVCCALCILFEIVCQILQVHFTCVIKSGEETSVIQNRIVVLNSLSTFLCNTMVWFAIFFIKKMQLSISLFLENVIAIVINKSRMLVSEEKISG